MGRWSSSAVVLDPIQFDGDSIQVSVKRIRVEDMMLMSKFFNKDRSTMAFDNPLEVSKLAADIMPKYVVAITGMKKADGVDMSLEEFLGAIQEFYFVPFVGALFNAMMSASIVRRDEAKN